MRKERVNFSAQDSASDSRVHRESREVRKRARSAPRIWSSVVKQSSLFLRILVHVNSSNLHSVQGKTVK